MSAAKEKFLKLLGHVAKWQWIGKEEYSFLLQPWELVVGCNDYWATND